MNYKNLTQKDLKGIFANVHFKIPPLQHQLISLVFALDKNRKRICFWHDIGTGKTAIALLTFLLWGCKKGLIVCPNSVIPTWKEEIKKHTDLSYIELLGTTQNRKDNFYKKADLYIINYEGLKYLFGQKVNKRFKIDYNMIKQIDYDCLIVDEIHHVKSKNAGMSKISREISRKVSHCIGLTGTPITKNEIDLWSEYMVIDLGQSLGTSYYGFLNSYFRKSYFDWKLKKGSREKILLRLYDKTLRYERVECFDLPPLVREKRYVSPTNEQLKLINKIENDLLEQYEKGIVTHNNVLVKINKLAQVAGGFLIQTDGKIKQLQTNPKLQELENCLDEIEGKCIIVHHFNEEGRMLEQLCKKKGIKYASLRGEIKDKENQIKLFKNNPKIKILIMNPQCGGEGLNFQVASIMIFYSNNYSSVARIQTQKRIYRLGQDKKCLIIDLICYNSIDEKILKILEDKLAIQTEILNWIGNRFEN